MFATFIGAIPSKLLVVAVIVTEGLIVGLHFGDWVLGGFLLAATPLLLVDLLLHGSGQYSRKQFTLLGIAMNLAGVASMFWVWFNRSLS